MAEIHPQHMDSSYKGPVMLFNCTENMHEMCRQCCVYFENISGTSFKLILYHKLDIRICLMLSFMYFRKWICLSIPSSAITGILYIRQKCFRNQHQRMSVLRKL